MFDLFVALTLLATVMSVATPLAVRHLRLLKSQRDYRLALDELANQLERLTPLPAPELDRAVAALRPSPFIAERLPGAAIAGMLDDAAPGRRITLRLVWNSPGRHEAPVALAGWSFTALPPGAAQSEGAP